MSARKWTPPPGWIRVSASQSRKGDSFTYCTPEELEPGDNWLEMPSAWMLCESRMPSGDGIICARRISAHHKPRRETLTARLATAIQTGRNNPAVETAKECMRIIDNHQRALRRKKNGK